MVPQDPVSEPHLGVPSPDGLLERSPELRESRRLIHVCAWMHARVHAHADRDRLAAGELSIRCHEPVAWARAASRPRSSWTCQAWNDAPAGTSVSVIVVTGMPAALASSIWRWMSGVAFWLLYT